MNDLKTVRDALRGVRMHKCMFDCDEDFLKQCKEVNKALATLDRMIETPAPQGWKLVPLKPTGTMLMYGIHVQERDEFKNDGYGINAEKIYKAMLSAAPTPAPTERVERIEGLGESIEWAEYAVENNFLCCKQGLSPIIKAARAQLKLQSGETEKVDLDVLTMEVKKKYDETYFAQPFTKTYFYAGIEETIDHLYSQYDFVRKEK